MSTQTIDIADAREHLLDLITTASEGGEVVILDNGKPLARLIPANDSVAYHSHPPTAAEFWTDDEPLAWDAEGWENVA